jgi:hypothetical protein
MTTSSTQTQQSSQPWSVQQPYLTQAFSQASGNLSNAYGKTYDGQQVAQFTPDQLATFKNMTQFGGNTSGADTTGDDRCQHSDDGLQRALGRLERPEELLALWRHHRATSKPRPLTRTTLPPTA